MVTRHCLECGEPFAAVAAQTPRQEFCCRAHKGAWQNRRATRGAVIYDLFMAVRFERGPAKLLKVWTQLCRVARAYRDEDNEHRAGRRSWRDPRDVISERVWLRAVSLGTHRWKRPNVR